MSDAQTQAKKRQQYFANWYRSEHGQAVIQRGRDRRAAQRTRELLQQHGLESVDALIDLLARGGAHDAGD